MNVSFQSIITALLKEKPDLLAIYIFGSVATEKTHSQSDVDIAIWSEQPLDPLWLWSKTNELAQLLKRDVDLIDLASASTVMQYQIIHAGKCIYCASQLKCDYFETNVYAKYLRLNELRQDILQDIKQRGTIYGR